jgi:2'-5' RNA ligase
MLAVVAFPVLADEDGRKIEALRSQHDPNAKRVAPHFTLVFPTDAATEKALLKRMQDAAKETAPFAVALKRVLVHQEGSESYLFLVPEVGYDALMALHGRLNGAAAGTPVGKPAFAPHMTVGRLSDRKEARGIATKLVTEHFSVNGRVEALSIVKVPKRARIRELHAAPLRG